MPPIEITGCGRQAGTRRHRHRHRPARMRHAHGTCHVAPLTSRPAVHVTGGKCWCWPGGVRLLALAGVAYMRGRDHRQRHAGRGAAALTPAAGRRHAGPPRSGAAGRARHQRPASARSAAGRLAISRRAELGRRRRRCARRRRLGRDSTG